MDFKEMTAADHADAQDAADMRRESLRDRLAERGEQAARDLCKRPATPLPWEANFISEFCMEGSDDGVRVLVADFQADCCNPDSTARADIQYAIRACNAYPKLVKALKEASEELAAMYRFAGKTSDSPHARYIFLLHELGEVT